MMWGKKSQQIERLEGRVQQLEDLICPNRQHEWICIGRDHKVFGSSVETVYQYLCKRCKKVKWDFEVPWVCEKNELYQKQGGKIDIEKEDHGAVDGRQVIIAGHD